MPDDDGLQHMHREAHIMANLDHPHIIRLYERVETPREVMLVMEHAPKGELLDYIVSQGKLDEEEAKRFTRSIVSALVGFCLRWWWFGRRRFVHMYTVRYPNH